MLSIGGEPGPSLLPLRPQHRPIKSSSKRVDIYFSADVETDGPIPGPYSMLSLALVYAGRFDGSTFEKPKRFDKTFYRELKPISEDYESQALAINGLDREALKKEGTEPRAAMNEAADWVQMIADGAQPILVAYPLSFDWTWLFWYFTRFAKNGSPFNHSRCFDLKTAYAVKAGIPVSAAGRANLHEALKPTAPHSHHALDDAVEQAEIFVKLFDWKKP